VSIWPRLVAQETRPKHSIFSMVSSALPLLGERAGVRADQIVQLSISHHEKMRPPPWKAPLDTALGPHRSAGVLRLPKRW